MTTTDRAVWFALLVALVLAPACAHQQTKGQAAETREALQALFETQPPSGVFGDAAGLVPEWTMEAEGSDRISVEVAQPEGPWGGLFAQAVQRRAGLVTPTRGLDCVAQELGRYFLEHRTTPDRALLLFLGSRCGSPVVKLQSQYLSSDVPAEMDDAKVFDQWKDAATKVFDEGLGSGQRLAGYWFGRKNGKAVLMVASGERLVHVEPISLVPDEAGRILIRGEVLTPTVHLSAAVASGPIGVADCEADASVALPRFAFTCRPNLSDEEAWIEVTAGAPNRFLGDDVLHLLVYPKGELRRVFHRKHLQLQPSEGPLVPAFLSLVNQVRRTAAMPPMSLSNEQSRTASRAAPYFFASLLGRLPTGVADLVAMGLYYGEDVGGLVQDGSFAAGWVPERGDPLALLDSMVDSLNARRVLFNPSQTVLAVGLLEPDESKVTAVLLSGYSFFDDLDPETSRQKVFDALVAARKAAGSARPSLISEIESDLDSTCRALSSQKIGNDAALQRAAELTVNATHASSRSWLAEATSLDKLEFPTELLAEGPLFVSISVGLRRPTDGGFARYVILIGFSSGDVQTASAETGAQLCLMDRPAAPPGLVLP